MKGLDLAEGFEDSGVSWVETFSGDCFRGGLLGVANISSARFQVRETRFVAVMRYIPISWAISFPHPLPHPCAQRDEMYEADVRGEHCPPLVPASHGTCSTLLKHQKLELRW